MGVGMGMGMGWGLGMLPHAINFSRPEDEESAWLDIFAIFGYCAA